MIRTDLFLAEDCEACDGKGRVVERDEDGPYAVDCGACKGDGAERCIECDGPAAWLVIAKDERARTMHDVERVHACGACLEAVKDSARDNYARRADISAALSNARCAQCTLTRIVAGESAAPDRDCSHTAGQS